MAFEEHVLQDTYDLWTELLDGKFKFVKWKFGNLINLTRSLPPEFYIIYNSITF